MGGWVVFAETKDQQGLINYDYIDTMGEESRDGADVLERNQNNTQAPPDRLHDNLTHLGDDVQFQQVVAVDVVTEAMRAVLVDVVRKVNIN